MVSADHCQAPTESDWKEPIHWHANCSSSLSHTPCRLPCGVVPAMICCLVRASDLRLCDAAAPQATEIGQPAPAFVRVPLQECPQAPQEGLDDVRPDRVVEHGRRTDLHCPAAQQEIVQGVREGGDATDA